MNDKPYIIYRADDASMGDTPAMNCESFRAWAKSQLEAEYPNHDITVSSEPSLRIVITNDDESRDGIEAFCDRLWDRCAWNFGPVGQWPTNYAACASSPQGFFMYLIVTAASAEEAESKFVEYLKDNESDEDPGYTIDGKIVNPFDSSGEWYRLTHMFPEAVSGAFPSVYMIKSGANG